MGYDESVYAPFEWNPKSLILIKSRLFPAVLLALSVVVLGLGVFSQAPRKFIFIILNLEMAIQNPGNRAVKSTPEN